jgi:hypothetical protein
MMDEDVTLLTENQKFKNYLEITESIGHIKNGSRITEDWMEQNKEIILKWRDWIENYALINPEVNDRDFRKKCSDIEVLLQHLCSTIKYTKTFEVKIYAVLLNYMKEICEYLFSDNELDELMGNMSM